MVTRTYGHTHTWSPTHTVHHGRRVHLYVFFFYEFIILIKEIDHPNGIYQTLTHDFKTLRHLSQSLHLYALHWSNGEHTSKCKGSLASKIASLFQLNTSAVEDVMLISRWYAAHAHGSWAILQLTHEGKVSKNQEMCSLLHSIVWLY